MQALYWRLFLAGWLPAWAGHPPCPSIQRHSCACACRSPGSSPARGGRGRTQPGAGGGREVHSREGNAMVGWAVPSLKPVQRRVGSAGQCATRELPAQRGQGKAGRVRHARAVHAAGGPPAWCAPERRRPWAPAQS
jgi:hypothetical protein